MRDVEVEVEGGTVSSCDVVAPGVLEVGYDVNPDVKAVCIRVIAYGFPVAGSPWHVRGSLVNKCVQEINVGKGGGGLSVSPDGSLLAVCFDTANEVRIFSLPDGKLMQTLRLENVSVDPLIDWHLTVCASPLTAPTSLWQVASPAVCMKRQSQALRFAVLGRRPLVRDTWT